MATQYDNNLKITSKFGYKRSGGSIASATPAITETTKHLWESVERPNTSIGFETRILRHSPNPVPAFEFPPGTTSTYGFSVSDYYNPANINLLRWITSGTTKTITLFNDGNSPITVSSVTQNPPQPLGVVAIYHTDTPFVIPPNSSTNFSLAYYGSQVGDYSSYIIVNSDFPGGVYKIPTNQIVARTFDMQVSPGSQLITATQLGQEVFFKYSITPVYDLIPNPDRLISYSVSLDGGNNPGWSLFEKSEDENSFTIRLRVLDLDNKNDIYTSTVTIISDGGVGINSVVTVTNTVDVSIDKSKFKTLGSWVSPAAAYNSVVGMSYDLIDNVNHLTIGVGLGGDGIPFYEGGGYIYTSSQTLNYLATVTDFPYTGWATVYRFPLSSNTPVTYYSSATNSDGIPLYKVKSTQGLDYETHFGVESSVGSMFIVDYDGNGNVEVNMNQLRAITDDQAYNTTLKNLTRSFYYYSTSDSVTRYYQLANGPLLDGRVTELFRGFDNSGTVLTSIVDLPRSF